MANRPTQLGTGFLWVLVMALLLSFITGLGLWYIHELREELAETPRWTWLCQALHGALNPLIAALFGYLCFSHIPGGWQMRANRKSGAFLLFLMAGLILTGIGLYYAANRHLQFTLHLVLGLLLPFALGIHWAMARKWIRGRALK